MAPDARRRRFRAADTSALGARAAGARAVGVIVSALVGALLLPVTAAAAPVSRAASPSLRTASPVSWAASPVLPAAAPTGSIAIRGGAPIATAISPQGTTLWALSESGTVTAISLPSGTVRTSTTVGARRHCTSLAVVASAVFAGCGVVTKSGAVTGSVVVLNQASGAVQSRISLGRALPLSIVAAPRGTTVYVATEGAGGRAEGIVTAIRVRDGVTTGSVDVVGGGLPLALSPSGKTLYVGSSDDPFPGPAGYRGTLTVLRTATMTPTATVSLRGRPVAIALSPGGGAIHVATAAHGGSGGHLETVRARGATISAVTVLAGRPTALAATGTAVAIAAYPPGNPATGSVEILDPATRQITSGMTTPSAQTPVGIAAGVLYVGTANGVGRYPLDELAPGPANGTSGTSAPSGVTSVHRLSVAAAPVVKGTLVAVPVRLRTPAGKAVSGQQVTVTVTGANAAARIARTDGNGRATVYYPSAHSGVDTVTASASGVSQSATVRIRKAVQRPTLTAKPTTKHRIAVTVQTNPVVAGKTVTIYVLKSGAKKLRWLPAGTLTTDATGWASGTVQAFTAGKTHRFTAGSRYVLSAKVHGSLYQQDRSARVPVTAR